MADPRIPADELGEVRQLIQDIFKKIRELEKPTGTQLSRIVDEVRALVDNLDARVEAYILLYSMTRAEIIGLAWFGTLIPGKGGTGTTNVHNTTSGGVQLQVFVRPDGQLTVGASTERLKTDIQVWEFDIDVFLSMVPKMFRWRDDIEATQTGELAVLADDGGTVDQMPEAPFDYGLIAEEAEALGLIWLVRYGPDGRPDGIHYPRVQIALLAVARHQHRLLQAQQTQIDDLGQRMTALEGKE